MWYGVLQFIPTSIILWIATAISLAVGTYCKQSNNIHFAHIWLTVFKILVTTVAILSSLRFYGKNKAKLLKHKILLKLFTFKGIIGLNVLQTVSSTTPKIREHLLTQLQFIISILSGRNVLKPTKYMTYHDVNTGLASLILACEMPIFACLLVIAFSPQPYRNTGGPAAGPLSAIVDAFNISDLLSAFVRGPMRLVREQQRQIMRQNSVRVGGGMSGYDGETEYGSSVRMKEPRTGSVV